MAHPNEELARTATEALSKGDMETFLGLHTDDTVLHFPGRGPLAGVERNNYSVPGGTLIAFCGALRARTIPFFRSSARALSSVRSALRMYFTAPFPS